MCSLSHSLNAFLDVSVIKYSHHRLTGTSMSQAARRFVFDKIQFYPTLSPIGWLHIQDIHEYSHIQQNLPLTNALRTVTYGYLKNCEDFAYFLCRMISLHMGLFHFLKWLRNQFRHLPHCDTSRIKQLPIRYIVHFIFILPTVNQGIILIL